MSRLEVIPAYLMRAELVDEVVAYIKALPGTEREKKPLLCEWCKVTGVPLTGSLVDRVFPRRRFVSG